MQKINFNDRYGLTDAVIEGRKIMTRRVVPWDLTERWMEFVSDAPSVGGVYVHESEKDFYEREAPRYKIGEVMAVAQRYSSIAAGHPDVDTFLLQVAKAHKISIESVQELAGWNNKMFTKAELMPHRIRITGIKCERLQDISDEDCMKEGIREDPFPIENPYYFGDAKEGGLVHLGTPREAFASLIDRVSGKGTWGSNPWVVVYEFELVK